MALYKRENSKYWWMKFTFDGELVQQSTKVANKRDAATVESAYRTQLALGKIGIKPKEKAPTFREAVQDFLKWLAIKHSGAKGTFYRYEFSCKALEKYFGTVRVDRITAKDVENFLVWRCNQTSRKTKEKITRETVNRDLTALKMIFRRLFDANVLLENSTRKIKQLKANARSFHVISKEEQIRYLLAAAQPLRDVATLMLETGLRCGEVYNLQKQDVSIEKGFLKVAKGKTKSSIRQIHLTDTAMNILEKRFGFFRNEFLFPLNDIDGSPPVTTLNVLHREVIKKLKFDFRLYDCRHTFATRAIESGVDLVVLASLLGHSNLQMVTRYAHPSETLKTEAIKKMSLAKAV
jgi:integrase